MMEIVVYFKKLIPVKKMMAIIPKFLFPFSEFETNIFYLSIRTNEIFPEI
jgi:hypothetical protein